MKKNLYLLIVFILLLLGTYFFQEVKTRKELKDSLTADHLVLADQITTLKWNDVHATKKNGQWWDGDRLLSHNKMKEIEKRIGQIKKIKLIEGNFDNYFTEKLEFTVNNQNWVVGDLTLDKLGFYLARDKEIMVAVMEGEGQELTDDPNGVIIAKLKELKTALSFPKNQMGETQLFRFYPDLPSEKVNIESDGRLTYELDFAKNATSPMPIKGILVHENIFGKFTSLLTQMTIREEVNYSEKLKKNKIGQIIFSHGKELVLWELWLTSDKSADPYIIDSKLKKAWKMSGGTLRIFFIQLQDYWDKKVIPPEKFTKFSRLKTTFIQGSKSAVVEIIDHEPLMFKTQGYKIDSEKMNFLFQYVFNLGDHDQADRVSQLTSTEKKIILSNDNLRLEVLGQDIVLWRKSDELIVVNLTQGYKAHFLSPAKNFLATFEDMLK